MQEDFKDRRHKGSKVWKHERPEDFEISERSKVKDQREKKKMSKRSKSWNVLCGEYWDYLSPRSVWHSKHRFVVRQDSPPVGSMVVACLDHSLDLDGWPHAPSFADVGCSCTPFL